MEEQDLSRSTRHDKRPPRKVGRYIVASLLTLLVLLGGVGIRMYGQTKNAFDKSYAPVSKDAAVASEIDGKSPLSILLLGTDTGAFGRTEQGNSDTMILVTINPETKKTTMVSIPRDTMAQIVGGDQVSYQKVNAAYNIGGSEAAMKTVTKLLNVPINFYVTVNMAGMTKIVDAVGGVDVNVKFSWTDKLAGGYSFTKGKAHLDGAHALAYARMRYEDPEGDYGRQKRQREVIQQIVKKALSADSLSNFQGVMDSLSDAMRTNLTFDDITAIADKYRAAASTISSSTLQGTGAYINAAAYQVPSTESLQKTSDKIRKSLGLQKETLSNYNTKQNELNAKAGFDWEDGNNPTYTMYDQVGEPTATDEGAY